MCFDVCESVFVSARDNMHVVYETVCSFLMYNHNEDGIIIHNIAMRIA